MRISFPVERLLRVRVRVHYSWILVIILIVLAVVTQFSVRYDPFWIRVACGLSSCLLFFIVVFVREYVVGLIAINRGIEVKKITFFAFGGLSQIDQKTTTPGKELLLAIAGMLYNLVIAGVFFLAYTMLSKVGHIVIDVLLQWLAFILFMLFLFHFVPGYPLDAGRILRAFLWRLLKERRQATHIANWTSWTIGLLITLGGIFILATTVERFTGAFLTAVGLILQNAATNSRRQERELTSQLSASAKLGE